jgi:hypothetical protein
MWICLSVRCVVRGDRGQCGFQRASSADYSGDRCRIARRGVKRIDIFVFAEIVGEGE